MDSDELIAKSSEISPANSSQEIVLSKKTVQKFAKKKTVLDEDTYTEEIEKIVTRDFFPDLNKLKAQHQYIEALENNDYAKLHEIQMAYRPKTLLRQLNTPSTFETPDVARCDSPDKADKDVPVLESAESYNKNDGKSLDEFLAENTSEDNASFETIMEKSAVLHQQKHPWLYKDEVEEKRKISDMLTLPSSENNSGDSKPNKDLVTWAYKNKNALMYVPDGVELTTKEKILYEKRQEIVHNNTRFASAPFDEQANKAAIAEAASLQAKMKEGKVGIDGKELLPDESPTVNGYGFVATPSPAPGVTDTPIMTWGEIEGTPFRLDGSDTPLPQNPGEQQFKIPHISAREKLAMSLADKAAKKRRKQKEEAKKHIQTSWLTPSPKFGSSRSLTPIEKLNTMSPAAQKLARIKLGIHRETDNALRASYSPSPLHTPLRDKTPLIGSESCTSPVDNQSIKIKSPVSSLPVNVTQLCQRKKAKDFF